MKMFRVPIRELDQPKSGLFLVFCNYWWPSSNQGELYFFGTDQSPYSSPQCNSNQQVVIRIASTMIDSTTPGCRYEDYAYPVQLPVIYVPTKISDYL